jgi:hypothetical protein
MSTRYFTVEEANELLPEIEPLVAHLLERRARVVDLGHQMGDLLDTRSGIGGPVASELVQEFVAVEQLVERIQSYGCLIKDINTGLLDFLAERNGREVYLCWRYGEPKIEFYHDLHTGFKGRRPV